MKQAAQVSDDIFLGSGISQNNAALVQRLFYGIEHPKWFPHLKQACHILRTERDHRFPRSDGSLLQCHRARIHLKGNGLVGRIIHRYNSAEFVGHRNRQRKLRRVSSNVLKDMLLSACPELRTVVGSCPEFEEGLEDLRSGLKRGRHWYALAAKFGAGILAVVPVHPSFGLSSISRIEDMPDKAFDLLIDMLERRRGEFLCRLCRALSRMRDVSYS